MGKTTRPFRYDLNQIPYDYTVEVRNRCKGLDLIDRVSDELWMEIGDFVQETGSKTIPKKKTLESPLECREIEPVHTKGDQSWVFIGRTDVEAETPMLWPPHAKS